MKPNRIKSQGPPCTPRDRVVAPAYKFILCPEFTWAPTKKQRLQIACGYNIKVAIRIATMHSPGQWEPRVKATTTKELPPKEGK